jgi:hypothetical protein
MRDFHSAALAVAGILIAVLAVPVVAEDKPPRDLSKLSFHQKRVLRWTLVLNTRDCEDYTRQLDALGAILAVPDKGGRYRIIRDLKQRPAKGDVEDLAKIGRIFWVDDEPESVRRLAKALQLDPVPPQVITLFPEKLEQELLKRELDYSGLKEDEIEQTWFKVVRRDGKYVVEVADQKPIIRSQPPAGSSDKPGPERRYVGKAGQRPEVDPGYQYRTGRRSSLGPRFRFLGVCSVLMGPGCWARPFGEGRGTRSRTSSPASAARAPRAGVLSPSWPTCRLRSSPLRPGKPRSKWPTRARWK